ncbi:MAG TPA: carbamoyltransferase HypF, partial [Candidatus Tenderia electrophaga]|nr:carbamoyltransferase HypF [Candidatus Tenderia electrophaga]
QTITCAECGPRLSMPIKQIVAHLQQGMILAIKGLSGFHLLCDAKNDAAVQRLRQRKQRAEQPLAIMVANIASAKQLAHINNQEAQLLQSQQRPIVVLSKKNNQPISKSVAPGLKWLGIMLPYTPLHYLLFHQASEQPNEADWLEQAQSLCLVMTSANTSGEPLIIDNDEARQNLSGIADLIIDHDRVTLTRCDDSVVRVLNQQTGFIRRGRGYAPLAIKLPHAIPATLAVGGHLKNTICITRDDEAFVSQHIGDLNNAANLRYFENSIEHLLSLLNVTPERIAHDLHPDFHSTRYAQSFGLPCYAIQHHHAHLAAVAAEHNIDQPAIGLVLDGFGLGSDQRAWGGELLLLNGPRFQRLGHLQPLKQPGGGDAVAREPWRMAASLLQQIGRGNEIGKRFQSQPAAKHLAQLLQKNIHSPSTSSCGRLFDTANGLLGLTHKSSFEAQAAMQLESLVTTPTIMDDGWQIKNNQLDFSPLLTAMLDMAPVAAANLFHGTLIAGLSEWAAQTARQQETDIVLLSGGCFLNQTLTSGITTTLKRDGFKPCLQTQSPINDA